MRVQAAKHDAADKLTHDGLLLGEVLVFTGKLIMLLDQAADMASAVGYAEEKGVTKRTTVLAVGDPD